MAQISWDDMKAGTDTEINQKITPAEQIDYISEPHVACCLLVDTSSSMRGQKINELNNALQEFKEAVCMDPLARLRVDVCLISFDSVVKVVTPFCPILKFNPPILTATGTTAMATGIRYALEAVHQQVSAYHKAGIQCYKPFVLMITDGEPTEDMGGIAELIQTRESQGRFGHLRFHAFGVKGANMELLASLTHRVLAIDNDAFREVFNWASRSMQIISHSRPDEGVIGDDLTGNMYPYDPQKKKLPWND